MPDGERSQRWWQTLPGALTATAAVITAVTGLIVAVHQTGLFDVLTGRRAQPPGSTSGPAETIKPSPAPAPVSSPAAPAPVDQHPQPPRILASGSEARLGSFRYKILAAQLEQHNAEQLGLRFTVRMTNNGRYPANFWDDTFRLLVDGVPTAPRSGLNKLVQGQSAEEGEVEFVVPAAAKSVVLRLRNGDDTTEIPIDLSAKSPSTEQKK
jgi:hypothetical protein